VNGKVYNLTKWITKHPGGSSVIKSMCGKDATAAFKARHGLTGRPASALAAYKIGTLAKSSASPTPTASPTSTATATPTPTATTGATLNLALVATHNTAANCWTIVNGNVYNLTAWIALHPGGPNVIQGMCGIDASAAYTGQHGSKSKPAGKLAQYLVGAVGATAP
jgi:cytochrome b involved in lipid metabolism